MNDLKLSALIIFVFTICLIVGWSRLEHFETELSDLRDLKTKDSIIQVQRCDSLIEAKFGEKIKD